MAEPKRLVDRERELQSMLRDPSGREFLYRLAEQYGAESGKTRPSRGSIITYLLVCERERNLIQ